MAIDIVETIQKNLGFPALQKIDPNTQEVKKPENLSAQDYLPQAAIPAVLLGLYKFSGDKDGNAAVLSGSLKSDLLKTIFHDHEDLAISKVASYTNNTTEYTASKMELIAGEATRLVKENISGETTDSSVKDFLLNQKKNILVYLPAELQLGKVLDDNTIDDRTNKMEGPMSTGMHWLEKFFPSTDTKKEENF